MLNIRLSIGLVVGLFVVGAGCSTITNTGTPVGDTDTSPIKIGWVGPLSGDAASIGQDALAAAEIAREEVNSAGGIQGRPLEFVIEDDHCNAKDATAAGTKLITVDKVPAIIGGLCSGETLAIAPMAEEHATVLFSPCSSAPDITTAGDYVFRSYPSDAAQGKFVADYVYNTLGKNQIALLVMQTPWGQGIAETFTNEYIRLGGTIVVKEEFSQEARDMRGQLTKIKNSDPDLLYFLAETQTTLVGLKQLRELGITIPVVGGDVWDDSKIIESSYADDVIYTVPMVDVPTSFRAAMKQKNADVTICAPGSYTNVKILADIMNRVGTNSEDIKSALYDVKDFPGINGPITLDEYGDVVGASYQVKRILGGEAVTVE